LDRIRKSDQPQTPVGGIEENDSRIPAITGAPKTDPDQPAHSIEFLVREMGRIQQNLARIEHQLAREDRANTERPVPVQMLTEIKERQMKEAISSARERREIRKEVASLKAHVEHLNGSVRFSARSVSDIPEEQLRVGIFVDVQNIFYAAKQFNARLDFEKLLKVAVGKRRMIRAMAYVVQSPEVDQTGFISMLQQKGYEIRQKDLRLRSDGSAKGDWDMGMAIDIMELMGRLDVVAIVTGDGDFVSLLNLIKTIGPRVEVISFLHNTARDLIQSADLHIPIEETLLLRPSNGNSFSKPVTTTPEDAVNNPHEAHTENQES